MTSQTDVLVVFGTRPEAIKLAPVVSALRALHVGVEALGTGQHDELLGGTALADSPTLGIASQDSVPRCMREVRRKLRPKLVNLRPKIVVVQGDTASACTAAQAAHAAGVCVAHVEAGVRSGNPNDPWPEESLRREIDQLATWRYAPSARALTNLRAEHLDGLVTGNTGVDALYAVLGTLPTKFTIGDSLLVTLHRREFRLSVVVRDTLRAIMRAVRASRKPAAWLMHPAMTALVEGAYVAERGPASLVLASAVPPASCVATLRSARAVLTDSGGLTEEAATLGIPTAILRFVNDRPEAVEAGVAQRFDPTPDGVVAAFAWLSTQPQRRERTAPFGRGDSSPRIAQDLARILHTM